MTTTNLYLCDVEKFDSIRTVCYAADDMEQAKARSWDHGDPVADPEALENTASIEYHEYYAVETTGKDVIHHAFKDIPL